MIQIKNLMKSYGKNPVLKNITIDIAPSQVTGYIGPNGAGKSTTIKILAGLLSYFSGDVFIVSVALQARGRESCFSI
jgi:ABC-2 type transport system ATP-binding protein